jgi:biotin carboxylase
MKNHILCIASEHKGNEFLEEARERGWHVTLVTRKKLLDEPWPWTAVDDVRSVEDNAMPVDYVRAITNVAGTARIDRVVGLDEFDVITGALAREHLQLSGMTSSFVRRFRDKLTMRNIACSAGVPCPDYVGVFNQNDINEFLERVPPPWIIKPRNEVSAFGIRRCETRDEVWAVLTELDNRNTWRDHPSQFQIEKFIEGRVFHVDSVVHDGKVVAAGVSRYGTTPFRISHQGGVFSSSIVGHRTKERKALEKLNSQLLAAFEYKNGVSHAEFLQSDADGSFYLLEVACRVGGAYIANVLEHAAGFNLWREWAKLETSTAADPYKPPKVRKDYAGITLALANIEAPDTSHYADAEIVYRVNKPRHVGLIFTSPKQKRVDELISLYTTRITSDFLAVQPAKERHDDSAFLGG